MLSLFVSSLLPVQADLGIALAVSNAGHAQIHTDLAALAVEVGQQLIQDELLVLLGDVGVVLNGGFINAELVLSGQLGGVHYLELGAGNLAQGALEIGGHLVSFVDVTANGANKLFHKYFLQNFNFFK
jgi:hypothetical protein